MSPIATLSANGSKARYGVAFVSAICCHAGVEFKETSPDADVLAVDGTVQFESGPARVQIKCTGRFRITSQGTASWPAEAHWWAKWHKSKIPVYFVLVIVDPDDQFQWLNHLADSTLHKSAAFWVRVDKMAASESVVVPKAQRLTAATLIDWASDVEACYA
jgi:hypothetical protein